MNTQTIFEDWKNNQKLSQMYCNPPCEPRPQRGRSWWKAVGYNSTCRCAYTKSKKIYEKDKACHQVTEDGNPTTWIPYYGKYDYKPDPDFVEEE